MGSGTRVLRVRFAFSLLMTVMLVSSMIPLTFAEEATPDAPVVVEESGDIPAVDPAVETTDPPVAEVVVEEPAAEAPAVEAVVEEPEAPVSEPASVPASQGAETTVAPAAVTADEPSTREIGLDHTTPLRCEPGYWMFVLKPKPVAPITPITVTFSNGNVETVNAVTSGSGQASFRTATNRDSTVVSAVAVVPGDFQPTSFVIQAGPCNTAPVPGTYDVTIKVTTTDGKSALGAGVTITKNDGTVTVPGTIGADNAFLAADLPDGGYTVSIDGWPAQYNRVSAAFSVTNSDRAVDVKLTRMKAGSIELQVQETRDLNNARIPGVGVSVVDINGAVVARGTTNDSGVFRTDVLPPSIYTITVDGRDLGYRLWTAEISNERGSHVQGVVLERLPEEAAVTIVGQTFDGGSAEGAIVSIKGPGSVEIYRGTLNANNTFEAGVLPNGTYSVTVNAYDVGYAYMYGFVRSFTVAGEAVTVTVPLNDFPSRGSVSGTVKDAVTGATIPGAQVVVVDTRGNVAADETSSGGTYRIRNLVQGLELTVTVTAPGYMPATFTRTFPPVDAPHSAIVPVTLQPIENAKKAVVITVDSDAVTGPVSLVAPEGSSWILTNVKTGKVYRGEFSGPVPQAIPLASATGSGTFRLEVDAGEAFEPYTGEVTIHGNSGAFYVELVPASGDE